MKEKRQVRSLRWLASIAERRLSLSTAPSGGAGAHGNGTAHRWVETPRWARKIFRKYQSKELNRVILGACTGTDRWRPAYRVLRAGELLGGPGVPCILGVAKHLQPMHLGVCNVCPVCPTTLLCIWGSVPVVISVATSRTDGDMKRAVDASTPTHRHAPHGKPSMGTSHLLTNGGRGESGQGMASLWTHPPYNPKKNFLLGKTKL